MPIDTFNLEDYFEDDTDIVNDHPILMGREIFTSFSLTGLNRSPITKLMAYILAGYEMDGVPTAPLNDISVSTIAERLLVDGSFAIFEGNFIEDIYYMNTDIGITVITYIRGSDNEILDNRKRVYLDLGTVVDIMDMRYEDGGWTIEAEYISNSSLSVYIGDSGLLYYPQKVYWRLEEIEETIKKATGKSALANIISGDFVGSITKARRAFNAGEPNVWVPGKEVKVTHMMSSDIVSFLLQEGQWLLARYKESMLDYVDRDAVQMSGVSRRYQILPTLQFVSNTRDKIIDIYSEHGAQVTFEPFSVLDTKEKADEIANIERARELEAITDEELRGRIRDLMSFK